MNDRSIQTTIKSLRRELRELDQRRAKVVAALRALEELPAVPDTPRSAQKRAGRKPVESPLINGAATVLREHGQPMHIMALVTALQRSGVYADRPADKVRPSLVSALLRRDDIFAKPGRGMYGLAEWGDGQK